MKTPTQERQERLGQIYSPAFRYAVDSFGLGTTDSPVQDSEIIALARQAGIARGQRILEPCSGSGGVSRLLAKQFGCQVLGIDLLPFQLEQAREEAVEQGLEHLITYVRGDAATYRYEEESFDAAVDVFAWVHIADWLDLFRAIGRALAPVGRIVLYDAFLTAATTEETESTVKERWFDPGIRRADECAALLHQNGYDVIHREDRGRRVLANWREGLQRLEGRRQEFIKRFDEETYTLFADTISWTIEAHEKGELTAAVVMAAKA